MKNIFLYVFGSILMLACSNNKDEVSFNSTNGGYTINGKIAGSDSMLVVIQTKIDGNWVKTDSSVVENGMFELNGKVAVPEMQYIKIGDVRTIVGVFIENGLITINGKIDSLDNVEVSGSKIHDDYVAYSKGLQPFRDEMRALYPRYDMADSLGDKKMEEDLDSLYQVIYDQQVDYTKEIIAKNNDNALGAYLAGNVYYKEETIDELEDLLKTFTGEAKLSVYFDNLTAKVATWKKVAIGQPAIDFTQTDTSGVDFSLSSLRGKYVYIDFWASWCGPCRIDYNEMVELYNEYKDKDFEIVGVAFDSSKSKWLEAIQEDKLSWYHVTDLKGWKNEVGTLYGVISVPHSILIDKEGIIVAKNLRGNSLREKLIELGL